MRSMLTPSFHVPGLALDAAGRARLQELLDADAACCSEYGTNLGNDGTSAAPLKRMSRTPADCASEQWWVARSETVVVEGGVRLAVS